jgi:hypothetical protein
MEDSLGSSNYTESDSIEQSSLVVVSTMGSSHWGNDEEDGVIHDLNYQPKKQEEERIKRLATRERVVNEVIQTERDFVVSYFFY